jgi:hypothetical protein
MVERRRLFSVVMMCPTDRANAEVMGMPSTVRACVVQDSPSPFRGGRYTAGRVGL